MEKENKRTKKAAINRRELLVKLPLAAAALTLSGSFGFPVSTQAGEGTIFLKLGEMPDGIIQLSTTDFTGLQKGTLGTLTVKLSTSTDKRTWQTLTAKIADTKFISQLTELSLKSR